MRQKTEERFYMLLGEVANTDIAAIVASIVAAFGGLQGVRTILKRVGRLVEIAEELETKSKKLDEVVNTIENHSARMAEFERSLKELDKHEKILREHDAHLMATMEAADFGAWISDAGGLCLACNTALPIIMMCSRDLILGNSWRDAVHPDDRELVVNRWSEFVRGERSLFSVDYRFQSPEGKINRVHGTAIRPMIQGTRSERIYGWVKLIPDKV